MMPIMPKMPTMNMMNHLNPINTTSYDFPYRVILPPFNPMNVCPFNSKKTVNPESDVIFEFGNKEQYSSAASLAFPSNQKHG